MAWSLGFGHWSFSSRPDCRTHAWHPTRQTRIDEGLSLPRAKNSRNYSAIFTPMQRPAKLALADGTVYSGFAFGAAGEVFGEVVFNTSMTGYQEILTDPSYCGQIVTMTYPQIGNYGVNLEDVESDGLSLRGFVVRELCRQPSNFRCSQPLDEYLASAGILGIEGIDTRSLVRRIRIHGAMTGVLSSVDLDDESSHEIWKQVQLRVEELVQEIG